MTTATATAIFEKAKRKTLPAPMTRDEAIASLGRIRATACTLAEEVASFIRRRGHEALGFKSPAECLADMLGLSYGGAQHLVEAARTKEEIVLLLEGDPEHQRRAWGMADRALRPLAKLPEPRQKLAALRHAEREAGRRGKPLTGKGVDRAVRQWTGSANGRAGTSRRVCPRCHGTGWIEA